MSRLLRGWSIFRSRSPSYESVAVRDLEVDEVHKARWSHNDGRNRSRKALFALGLALVVISMMNLGLNMTTYYRARDDPLQEPPLSISRSSCRTPGIRREWRTLGPLERGNYISAVQCLSTKPSRLNINATLYDDFGYVHARVAKTIHDSASFLPWHRYFIHVYERTLREHCNYQGDLVYWDWARDWKDPTHAVVWDPETGFGGDGMGESVTIDGMFLGRCVMEGPFKDLRPQYFAARYRPHCLARAFTDGQLPEDGAVVGLLEGHNYRPAIMRHLREAPNYDAFRQLMEDTPHLAIPTSINGDMRAISSPNDPIFFLHHTQLDRLWWTWQRSKAPGRFLEYDGPKAKDSKMGAGLDDLLNMAGLAEDISVSTVMSTEGGFLCYSY